MTEDIIPPAVRAFIAKHVDSVAHLEILMLMHASPEVRWDIETISKRLYTTELQASNALRKLCSDGILRSKDDVFAYDDLDSVTIRTIDQLADAYRRQLVPITNLIHSRPRRIQEFADAFKFKKDK
jgi:hypothetical protein